MLIIIQAATGGSRIETAQLLPQLLILLFKFSVPRAKGLAVLYCGLVKNAILTPKNHSLLQDVFKGVLLEINDSNCAHLWA